MELDGLAAAMLAKVSDQVSPLHAGIVTSSYSPDAALRAASRFSSRISANASRKLINNSSFVRSCALTPGTSSTQPIHQSASFLIIALYSMLLTKVYRHGPGMEAA